MSQQAIHIDLDLLLRTKTPRYYPYIPRALVRWLERTVHQEEMNDFLARNAALRGIDFADAALRELKVVVNVLGQENLPAPGQGRYIFVSNHPLGGLDGVALISLLSHRYQEGVKCAVNDMLMQVKPLEEFFLPVNKHGRQDQAAVKAINQAYAGPCQVLHFPAGICSRRQKGGQVADLEWKKSFVTKSIEYQRDVVPLYFHGQNSDFFYKFARARKRLGIKLNIEMVYLPDEMFRCRGKTFTVVVGEPIAWTAFTPEKSHQQHAADVRAAVYELKRKFICNQTT